MDFNVIGEITDVETFATGRAIRELGRLSRRYGRGRWRKRKGQVGLIRFGGQVDYAILPSVCLPSCH